MSDTETTSDTMVTIYPIGIPEYRDPAWRALDVDAEITELCRLLADFGGRPVPWDVPADERDSDAVAERLRGWARQDTEPATVLYWAGHGWSDGTDAALAHHGSPEHVGVYGLKPAELAHPIAERQDHDDDRWTIVLIEACQAAHFVNLLNAELSRMRPVPTRVLLVGVSGRGSTRLGELTRRLRSVLDNTFRADPTIAVHALGAELEEALQSDGIVRFLSIPRRNVLTRAPAMTIAPPVTVEVDDELRRLLAELPSDELRHFVPKAQGGETGELPWYFEGREQEQRDLAGWLHTADRGMYVVTGAPGSGKSALLGRLVAQTNPELVAALIRQHLIPPPPDDHLPPPRVFDTALLLTGLTAGQTIRRIADDLDLGRPESAETLQEQLDWLQTALSGRGPATILIDALDEAQEPIAIAQTVLPTLAAMPHTRLIVGTRRSTREGPDLPTPPDQDLIDALDGGDVEVTVLEVVRDPEALRRYVDRRLTHLPSTDSIPDDVAATIVRRSPHFLYARLAVHEIAARPHLTTPAGADDLARLLGGDYRTLFAQAVARLSEADPAHPALLHALAIGLGRGLPIRDGIWTRVAGALGDVETPAPESIDRLLHDAAAYLMVDHDHGQTVYRLAHRTFQEHFLNLPDPPPPTGHRRVLAGLLTHTDPDAEQLNPYLTHHLAGHAALAGRDGLRLLDGHLGILDRLDLDSVTAAATGSLSSLPTAVAATYTARSLIAHNDPGNRQAIRQLAAARHSAVSDFTHEPTTPSSTFTLRWAHLVQQPHHLPIRGHTGPIRALAVLPGPDGRTLLASAGSDGTVRIWDPVTGRAVGTPLTGHTGSIVSLAVLPGPDGGALLASAGADGTVRIWDPVTGRAVGTPLTGHTGSIVSLAVLPGPDGGALLASAGADGTVRIWDPVTGRAVGTPLTGHTGLDQALAVLPGPDGGALLASAGADGTVRIWDPATGRTAGTPLTGHTGPIAAFTVVPGPDGGALLASAGADAKVRLWDPATGQAAGTPLTGHTGWIHALAVLPDPDGGALLASAGSDGTVRIWDPATGRAVGAPMMAGKTGMIWALVVVPGPDGRTLLASAGNDGTVRIWDPATGRAAGTPLTGHTDWIQALAVLPGPDGRTLLASAGNDGTVRTWDPVTGQAINTLLTSHTKWIYALAVVPGSNGRALLASAGSDAKVRLWDPVTGRAVGTPLTGHTGRIQALAVLPGPDGGVLLASAGDDAKVRLWDPATGQAVGTPLTGHTDTIWALAVLPGPDGGALLASAGSDGTVRIWDPATGRAVGTPLTGHTDTIWALAVLPGPDGRVLLASAGDGMVRLWDPVTGRAVGTPLTGHTQWIRALEVVPGPEGRALLASAGQDATIRVWDWHGECLRHIAGDISVSALAWCDEGLVAAGDAEMFLARLDLVPPGATVRNLPVKPLRGLPPQPLIRRLFRSLRSLQGRP